MLVPWLSKSHLKTLKTVATVHKSTNLCTVANVRNIALLLVKLPDPDFIQDDARIQQMDGHFVFSCLER